MDLDHAIAAHAQWKMKLRGAITAHENLDADTIGKDNGCELGKWLYGDGRGHYGSNPQFTNLIEKHKVFRTEAGKVARLINGKQFDLTEKAIDNESHFSAASGEVGVAVIGLKKIAAH